MHRHRHSILLILCLSLATQGLQMQAQEAPETDGDQRPPDISLRVLCSEAVEGFANLQLLQQDTAPLELNLIPSMVTDPLAVERGELVQADDGLRVVFGA